MSIPVDAEAQKYAIDLCFDSEVLTVDLFNKVVADPMKTNVATSMNTKCRDEKDTFAKCCPGKTWRAGLSGTFILSKEVALLNPDTDGKKFSLGLMLKANNSNTLCAAAATSVS